MDFTTYGMQQFAIGNDAKFRAIVSLALDIVASVENWALANTKVSKAEKLASLSTALTLAKVPETSARRFMATVSGLVTQAGKDFRETLASVKAAMIQADNPATEAEAVSMLASVLAAEGVENLSFLEAYARKGKPGLAAIAAETAAKVQEVETLASITEAEAAEAAKADQTPRAKAAKQAAAILASLAKHGANMTQGELQNIAAAVGEALGEFAKRDAAVKMAKAA